jgi:hypothetical protein
VAKPKVRTGMPSMQLNKSEFFARARARFYDPTFTTVAPEIEKIIEVAWKNYTEYHKSPRTHRAGRGFSDPEFAFADGMARNLQRHRTGGKTTEKFQSELAHSAHQRLEPQ